MRDMKATWPVYGEPNHFSGSRSLADEGHYAGYWWAPSQASVRTTKGTFNAHRVLAAMLPKAGRLAATGEES